MERLMPQALWGEWAQNEATTLLHGIQIRQSYGGWIIPDYQRTLVWILEQKIRFIESIWLKLPIGNYVYMEDWHNQKHGVGFLLLDGQQRWDAIFSYMDGGFPVFGYHYHELAEAEQRHFQHQLFPAIKVRNLTREQQVDIYNRLAYGGTPHDRPGELDEAGRLNRVVSQAITLCGIKAGTWPEDHVQSTNMYHRPKGDFPELFDEVTRRQES
jgi:hypothetical protein